MQYQYQPKELPTNYKRLLAELPRKPKPWEGCPFLDEAAADELANAVLTAHGYIVRPTKNKEKMG